MLSSASPATVELKDDMNLFASLSPLSCHLENKLFSPESLFNGLFPKNIQVVMRTEVLIVYFNPCFKNIEQVLKRHLVNRCGYFKIQVTLISTPMLLPLLQDSPK